MNVSNIIQHHHRTILDPLLISNLLAFLASHLACRSFLITALNLLENDRKSWVNLQKLTSKNGLLLNIREFSQDFAAVPDGRKVATVGFSGYSLKQKVSQPGISILVLPSNTDSLTSNLPLQVSSHSTFILARVGDSTLEVEQILRPSTALPPQLYRLASYSARNSRWHLHQTVPSLLSSSLEGVNVSVALMVPFGYPVDVVVRLFDRSAGARFWKFLQHQFKIRVNLVVMKRTTSGSFVNIDSSISQLDRGDFDFLSDLILISSERVSRLGFILVGVDLKYHFMVRRPEYRFSWLSLARPLSPLVWLSFVCLIFVIATALHIVCAKAPASTLRVDFPTSLMLAIGFSCNQACLGVLRSVSVQMVCISGLFSFYMLHMFYVSNLYSILSTREVKYPFNSIEEFAERKTHRMMIHPSTSVYSAFKSAQTGIMKQVWDEFLANDPGHPINDTNMGELVTRVCSGTTAVFALPAQMIPYQKYCQMQAVQPGYFPNQMGLASRKDFPFLPHFQILFLRAFEAGMTNKMNIDFFDKLTPRLKKEDLTVDPLPVSLQQVSLLFYIFILFSIITFILLLLEKLQWKHRRPLALLPISRSSRQYF